MTDLDAIRARDAKTGDFDIYTTSPDEGDKVVWAFADRRDLLAEVDRLTADLAYAESQLAHAAMPYPEADIDAERARIRAAVEGLPVYAGRDYTSGRVDRAAVLAAIDGPGPHPGGIEQFQDEDR